MMILKSHLLEGLVPEAGHNVTMKINIMKEEYETACDILAGKLAKRTKHYSATSHWKHRLSRSSPMAHYLHSRNDLYGSCVNEI